MEMRFNYNQKLETNTKRYVRKMEDENEVSVGSETPEYCTLARLLFIY